VLRLGADASGIRVIEAIGRRKKKTGDLIAEMIEAGLLMKTGNGPSTRLVVTAAGLAFLAAHDAGEIND